VGVVVFARAVGALHADTVACMAARVNVFCGPSECCAHGAMHGGPETGIVAPGRRRAHVLASLTAVHRLETATVRVHASLLLGFGRHVRMPR
jgi:hypothetical protein